MVLFGFIVRIYHDARSLECQIRVYRVLAFRYLFAKDTC